MPDHPFHEFLYRINFFTFDKGATRKRFHFKLLNFMRVVLTYIQANPSMVTDAMRGVMVTTQKFEWALYQTKKVETAVGIETVVPNVVVDEKTATVITPATLDHQMQEATRSVLNMVKRLSSRPITEAELRAMSPKERITAVAKLIPIFTVGRNLKPGKQVFKQINIHGAGREELEGALLAFNKNE